VKLILNRDRFAGGVLVFKELEAKAKALTGYGKTLFYRLLKKVLISATF